MFRLGQRAGFPSRAARRAAAVGSLVGLPLALALSRLVPSHAAPGQLPGYALAQGFNPRASVVRLLLLIAIPLIGGVVGYWIGARRHPQRIRLGARRSDGPRRPARIQANVTIPAIGAHAIVVWTFLLVPWAPYGRSSLLLLAGLLVVTLLLATMLGGGDPRKGSVFLAAACPVLPLALLGERRVSVWLVAGIACLALPIVARGIAAAVPSTTRWLRALTVFVLLPGSVTAFSAAAEIHGPGLADVFEDGHGLLPASEYLRGELPYRDVVPGHGLVADGLLQVAQIRLFGDDYRGLRRGEKVFGVPFLPGIYALGWAATGSAGFGFGALLFTILLFPTYAFFRALLSLWTLALAVHASRTKRAGEWFACGALLPVGLCTAVDFTVYAVGGVAVAFLVARGRRDVFLKKMLLGCAASAGVLAVVFAALGILGSFLRATFFFLPSLLPVYAQGFPRASIPRDLAHVGAAADSATLLYALAAIAAVLLGTLLPRAPAVGSRARGMLPVLAWVLLAMLSVLERQHVVYAFFLVPLGLLLVARWCRGPRPWNSLRALGPAAALVVLAASQHPLLIAAVLADWVVRPPIPPHVRPLSEPPRARGALFRPMDADLIGATAEMMAAARFGKNDTWLDFANSPGLYYLFDRDCPIRYYEVPFYESEAAQREVIAAVSRNPGVRAVLMGNGYGAIDGIAMSDRAPLVASFLRENFRPFYRSGGVEFWLRKEAMGSLP
jgi:hypothetical protein